MEIIDIKESGASNILSYALKNGASLIDDEPLVSLINDELFYLVSLKNLTLFQVFRLTQMYRSKLRILTSELVGLPSDEELQGDFGGESTVQGEVVAHSDLARLVIQQWLGLVAQMSTDSSIISDGAARLFIPMLARRYTVQIPVGFYDLFSSMSEKEISELFTSDYPNTLHRIIESPVHGVKTVLSTGIAKATQITRYDKRYDNYVKTLRYFPLKGDSTTTRLYRLGLLAFSKRDPIARTEIRFSLFNVDRESALTCMRRLSKLHTPLEVDIVLQLPIEYMQLLENSFDRDILPLLYESSMSVILESGIHYEDFKTPEWEEGPTNPSPVAAESFDTTEHPQEKEGDQKLIDHENAVQAYRVRIAEANENTLKAIQILMESGNLDISPTSIFSLLPSIYMATAVARISVEHLKVLTSHSDPIISSLFSEIESIIGHVTEDLRKCRDQN